MEAIDIFVIIVVIVSLIVGILLGILVSKLYIKRKNKKIERDAKDFIEGKRDNFIEVDGVKYDATKFRMLGEDGKEIVIDMKGGYKIYDGEEKYKEGQERTKVEPHNRTVGKNSRSRGEKKRDSGARRIRRFG